jgi:UrcA family protein
MTHALIAAGIAALTIAHPAAASTRTVSYADLDLSTSHGRVALDARVRSAARQVCEVGIENLSLADQVAERACMARAVSSAQQQFASIEARRTTKTDRLR